jgi:periplasmic protein TonB
MQKIFVLAFVLIGTANLYSQRVPGNFIPNNANVEQKAEFQGDENKWLAGHIKYPDSARNANIEGTVYVYFEIDTTGSISRVKLMRGICACLNKEAIRVVSSMPDWKPAMNKGKHIKVCDCALVHFEGKP